VDTWPKQRYRRPDKERRASARRRVVVRILRDNAKWLKQLPNVHHVGLSNKYKGGRDTGRPSITIYVTKKRTVKGAGKVPRRLSSKIRGVLRTVQTDVCELAGVPKLFNMRGGARLVSSDLETGTAGIVFSHHGKHYCITNAHVVADPDNPGSNSVTVPIVNGAGTVVLRDGLPLGDPIESDAALILLNTAVDPWQFYNTGGVLNGFVDSLSIGQPCFYTAATGAGAPFTFQCQLLAEVHGDAEVEVDGFTLTYRDFYRFSVLNGSPVGGHSGSLVYVVAPNGLFGAGLAFGGIEGAEIWAFPARRCFDRMKGFFGP
jgi:hypothetical protein